MWRNVVLTSRNAANVIIREIEVTIRGTMKETVVKLSVVSSRKAEMAKSVK
jgi:hypothetical protein